jgi:hypothetical protein
MTIPNFRYFWVIQEYKFPILGPHKERPNYRSLVLFIESLQHFKHFLLLWSIFVLLTLLNADRIPLILIRNPASNTHPYLPRFLGVCEPLPDLGELPHEGNLLLKRHCIHVAEDQHQYIIIFVINTTIN